MRLNLHEEVPTPGAPSAGATPQPAPTPAAPQIDQQTYDALVGYYRQTADIIEPVLQDEGALNRMRRYASDESYRRMVDEAERLYDEQAQRNSPEAQMPAWAKKLYEETQATRNLVTDKIIKPREEAETQSRTQYEQAQAAAARELMEKNGIDLPMLRAIAAYGDQLGLRDINDAYKHFTAAQTKEKPPASLRPAASTPGVPGPSGNPAEPPKNKTDFARRLANNLRSVRAS